MKVCFYMDNSKINKSDFSKIDEGNPGIGGTQFMILSLSYYLKKIYNDLDITIIAPRYFKVKGSIEVIKSESILEAVRIAKGIKSDIFIFKSAENEALYNLIDELQIKSIAWAHNFASINELNQIVKCNYVKRYVCVSKEQYLLLEDHKIINKSTFIYNAINTNIYKQYIEDIEKKENIICYLGALTPDKGFHVLAKSWRKIKRKVPNAKLWVVGSGQLYNSNAKMGKYNIAEEKYEKTFIRYLLDKNNKLDKDIKFFGVLANEEKLSVLSKAKVGVVNPTGRTETFGISAIEFQILGIPVVSKAKNCLVDTIKHKETGYLALSNFGFSRYICRIINSKKNEALSKNSIKFVEKNFSIYSIVEQWNTLFKDIANNNNYRAIGVGNSSNYYYNWKWMIKINKQLKKVNILKNLPSVYEYGKFMRLIIKGIL